MLRRSFFGGVAASVAAMLGLGKRAKPEVDDGWISVEDRLPKPHKSRRIRPAFPGFPGSYPLESAQVLVRVVWGANERQTMYAVAHIAEYQCCNEVFGRHWECMADFPWRVTHWRPLPSLPSNLQETPDAKAGT